MARISRPTQHNRALGRRAQGSSRAQVTCAVFASLAAVVFLISTFFDDDANQEAMSSSLLSLVGSASDSSVLMSRSSSGSATSTIPDPEKRPVVERSGKVLNDVISGVKMGVGVAGMMSHWEAVGADGQQHLHGFYGFTANGELGWTPNEYVPPGKETAEEKTEHHKGFAFNKWRSDQLPLSNARDDIRSSDCKAVSNSRYYQNLNLQKLATSVIFVAFNEPLSTLFRSIHSVLDRTPPELLHEIVLVDDASEFETFGEQLENYVALLPKTKLFRLKERKGLMAARVYGAQMATGETLTFLDSHIEAANGWLPPLLERLTVDRRFVTMPVIDSIDGDTYKYRRGGISTLGFTWALGQTGVHRSNPSNKTAPMASPIMAGGLFTMDRKWFFELGAYDEEFQIYGGEEMEISWKIWQCGGRLECIPCSHVGHIFRTPKYWKGQVFSVPEGAVVRNKLRAAEVWMEPKYMKLVREAMSQLPKNVTVGDVSKMKALRARLKCKSFDWYLETIYPELRVPNSDTFKWIGEVRHIQSGKCLDTMQRKDMGSALGSYPCHGSGGTQRFVGSEQDEIFVPNIGWDVCVDGKGQQVTLRKCRGKGGVQKWIYDKSSKQLQVDGKCLATHGTDELKLETCSGSDNQMWTIPETAGPG